MINITHWKCKRNNWGDAIGDYLAKQISGQQVKWFSGDDIRTTDVRTTVIGSIMQWIRNPNTIIWGIGFIREGGELKFKPKQILSVRGPLTRDQLIKLGHECPEVYGDPALLMPRFINFDIEPTYELGIIPHYIDNKNPWLDQFKNNPNIKIIDITNTDEEMFNHRFIKDVKSCKRVISSTLHGIICADAYGVPSAWMELSNNVIGNGFKFRDYFLSVGRTDMLPLVVNKDTNLEQLYAKFQDYEINIDLDLLYNSCPFKKNSII